MRFATLAAGACGLALAGLLAGCLHYSVSSSSSSGQMGHGGGGGGSAGGASGSAAGAAAGPARDATVAHPSGARLAWDPSLALYRVADAPDVWFDGYAFYRRTASGWAASRAPGGPWQPVTPDAVPPALRDR